MLIDWFTVAAQVVNFLVLVFLLRWLLWDRIRGAMDSRRERVESEYQKAEQARDEAEESAREKAEAEREFHELRDNRLREMREEVDEERERRLEKAREEVEARRREWREDLRAQQDEFVHALRRDLAVAVTDVTRDVLARVADADLEGRIVARLRHEVEELPDDDRELLTGNGALHVRTHWELDDAQRSSIETVLAETLDTDAKIDFDTEDDLVCGLRVRGSDHVIDLSVDRELERLAERLEERLSGVDDDGRGSGDDSDESDEGESS